jgi:hypothetical protein
MTYDLDLDLDHDLDLDLDHDLDLDLDLDLAFPSSFIKYSFKDQDKFNTCQRRFYEKVHVF